MLYQYIRAFRYNGSLTDISIQNQDDSATVALDLTANTHYIYIGQNIPFNNFFVYVDTANAVAANIKIEYWDGSNWREGRDILDGTSVSGAPFARSGVIQFTPDDRYGWSSIQDTTKNNAPSELQSLYLYDMHFLRISVSATLTPTAKAKTIAYAFTTTQQLNNLDVEINSFWDSFANGKTDWIPEILTASLHMIYDLKRTGLIVHPGQLLRFDDVSLACDYKTLILIYRQLGKSYDEKRAVLEREYELLLKSGRFTIDQNGNGRAETVELFNRVYTGVR